VNEFGLGANSNSDKKGDKSEPRRGDCSAGFCHSDYWVLKLDAAGNKVWDKTLGGRFTEFLSHPQQTSEGG
jgi:hypothetical protein